MPRYLEGGAVLEPLARRVVMTVITRLRSNATLKVLTLRSYPCTRILLLILSYYLTIETGQVLESRFAELGLLVLCWNNRQQIKSCVDDNDVISEKATRARARRHTKMCFVNFVVRIGMFLGNSRRVYF